MSDVSDRWRANTARGGAVQRDREERYRRHLKETLNMMHAAYITTSEPAPHPVWWKRLLRRPYRKGNPAAFMAELHRRHKARR